MALNNMSGDASSQSTLDIKQHFVTREGYYKNLPTYEYSRPNRPSGIHAFTGSQPPNLPVKISLVRVPDDDTGFADRILFNVGREIFLYAFKSIWEAPDLSRPVDRQIHKALPTCHDINRLNCSAQGCSVVVGFNTGSFQVSDPRKESRFYNEDRLLDKTKVTCVKWLPGSTQQFLVGFASGQILHCDDSLPWTSTLPSYQAHKQGDGFAVYTCKSRTPRNPVYRWTIGEGSLDAFAFSPCCKYLATASHDGFLRVFLFETFELIGTAKSYFGGLLCLGWSPDSKFVCAAGEDDLVHLFSIDSRKIVARGRGHRSWITAVAFDPLTSCLSSSSTSGSASTSNGPIPPSRLPVSNSKDPPQPGQSGQSGQRIITYRFATVGQDTQICLWELTDDIVKQSTYPRGRGGSLMINGPLLGLSVPPKSAPVAAAKRVLPLIGNRAAASAAAKSKKEEQERSAQEKKEKEEVNKAPLGSPLCPKLEEVPLLEPLVCKRIAPERLNDIVFHDDCILISTQEGVIMTWCRPGRALPNDSSSRQNSCSN